MRDERRIMGGAMRGASHGSLQITHHASRITHHASRIRLSRRALLAALLAAGCGVTLPANDRPSAPSGYAPTAAKGYRADGTLVDADWLAARLDEPALRLVDLSPWRRYLAGHLPDAVHLWWQDTIETNNSVYGMLVGPPRRTELLGRLGIDRQSLVVAYDDEGGRWAARLDWLLEFVGHERVHLLDGGVQAWLASGRALTTAVPQPEAARYQEAVRPDRVVEAEEVARLATLGAVVDGRTAAEATETWGGRLEVGRVAGALALPWTANLTGPAGAFAPADELRARYEPALRSGEPVAVYGLFGAGAALPYVALRALGVEQVQLYDGSWAEWGRSTASHRPWRHAGAASGLRARM
jgi:thiosulfate/3-mercaptopyruvate sulfurtransferase